MTKKILAFICTLALLVGLLPVVSLAEMQSTPETYLVGYAKKDINPWVDPKDHSQGVLPVYLTGNGNDSERACTGMMDDNGDGETDENDGLFTTCTAVTDSKGTTVLYITLDTLQGETTAVSDIRNRIIKELKDAEGNPVVNGNQIIISGSHTHSAPNLLNVKQKYKDTYYEYILTQVLAAAQEAYKDRAAAIMKRGSIDATTATAALGSNGGNGYQMNFLRHYQITAQYKEWSWDSWSYVTDKKSYVIGPSFSTGGTTVDKTAAFSNYKVTAADHVAEADNTMYLLQFEFAAGSKKEPIVMVNWRAHPTTNSGDYPTLVSSDYVNALRYQLSKMGYRAAFLQGAGANTIISSRYHEDWTTECPTSGTADTNTYGEILAKIADRCLKYNMTSDLSCGDIRIIQRTFTGELQTPSEGLLEIANKVTTTTQYPYTATATCDGKSYTINSWFHAEQVIARNKQKDNQDFVTQEIAVVSLGNAAAFVTAPNELSDRYGISSYSDTNNDWTKLINENTYGTPFVVTHANGMKGYLPNSLNYSYNTNVVDYKGNALPLGAGSYEANTSHYASGTGEKLIAAFEEMLAELDQEEETRYCEACDADVVWKPVSYLQEKDQYLGSGHYYYAAAPLSSAQRHVRTGEKLCLDLNGYTVTTRGRSFYVDVGGVLNILDSKGTGSIVSTTASGPNYLYGTFQVKGEMNIFGGSLQFDDEGTPSVDMGGVGGITDGGVLNMYGGEIRGTNLSNNGRYGDSGKGAAIIVYNGQLHICDDAKVISGTIPEEGGAGPCIALRNLASNKVSLSGNASVDDIYFDKLNYSNLTISGTFTGNVGLSYASGVTLERDTVIGTADNADVSNATFRLPETVKDWMVYVDGTNLKIKGYQASTVAVIGGNEYDNLQAAVNASAENSVIKLIKAVSGDATTTVDRNVYLDLNGYDITEAVTVNTGYTLYCMDSQTDDYTVEDEAGYGKLTNVSGNVEGIPEESTLAEDGYLKVVENDKEVSFHRVNLQLTAISLRAVHNDVCAPSVYYKSNFKGDQKVAGAVERYGIALSVQEMPNADNLDSKCEYSKFDTFAAGSVGNDTNGTLLYGIMKPTNKALINSRNANMAIYGRAYIQTETGYMFGHGYNPNLKQVTEAADAMLSDPSVNNKVKENIMENLLLMYNAYTSVMKSWNLPNVKAQVK